MPYSTFMKNSIKALFPIKLTNLTLASVVALVPTATVWAQASRVTVPDASCATSPGDAFEGAAKFGPGPTTLAGQCLDTRYYRPPKNVRYQNGILTFNNYSYRGQFWKAEIALDASTVESVYFHVKRFTVLNSVEAAHTQVRYKLKPGAKVRLTHQVTGERAEADDILISFEAGLTKTEGYNFAKGAFDSYILVGRAGETASITAEKPRPIEQYELDLTRDEKALLLVTSLVRSERIGLDSYYNTLRPNCTTEQFDLIDNLPARRGKAERFLTVISMDPVAWPSIEALQKRGLIKQRVQNFESEQKGETAVLQLPRPNRQMPPFIPTVAGNPWSIVVVSPQASSLNSTEREALATLRQEIVQRLMKLVQSYGSSALLAGVGGTQPTELLLKAVTDVQQEIRSLLVRMDSQLPARPQPLAVYFAPMQTSQPTTSLQRLGIEAALPFPTIDREVSLDDRRSQEPLFFVGEGAMKAADVGSRNQVPAYLMSAAIVISAARGQSAVTTQTMVGINKVEKAFSQNNDQVRLDKITIAPGNSRADRPVILISHHQRANAALDPLVSIEFGPAGGLAGTLDLSRFGTLQISKALPGSPSSCEIQARSAPHITGVFAQRATGNSVVDRFLQGRPVAFQVLGARMNLQRGSVEQMDVRVNTWPVSCRSDSQVETQFRTEANKALEQWKSKASEKKDVLMHVIETMLNN